MVATSTGGSAQSKANVRAESATAEIRIVIDGREHGVTVEARARHVVIAVDGKPPQIHSPERARWSAAMARAGGHHDLAYAIESAADQISEGYDA